MEGLNAIPGNRVAAISNTDDKQKRQNQRATAKYRDPSPFGFAQGQDDGVNQLQGLAEIVRFLWNMTNA
jgi:hypothetical protein